MKIRALLYGIWLLLSACLYFFENNTGTRILLVLSLAFLLIPSLRRALLSPDQAAPDPREELHPLPARREEEERDGVRLYQNGDSPRLIHWKLSAKRDALLVVEEKPELFPEEKPGEAPEERKEKRSSRASLLLCGLSLFLLLLLLLLPPARAGLQALANELFTLSEQTNAYLYERFPVSPDQPVLPARILLGLFLLSLALLTLLRRSRVGALLWMAAAVLFQVYFGLSFPLWVNLPLFLCFLLFLLSRPWDREALLRLAAWTLLLSLATALVFPGVSPETESASEALRDRLSRLAQELTGSAPEAEAADRETRHVHTRSLLSGEGEASPEKEYRLITREEEQIALPHWVNYLKIALLLLLTVFLVCLPFLPFLWVSRRRKLALEKQEVFRSEDISEAVRAIFRRVLAWLAAMELDGGNLPCRDWESLLISRGLPASYAQRFSRGALLYEEALYSTHPLPEEKRQRALALLAETEELLKSRANRRQKMILKYREWLWL